MSTITKIPLNSNIFSLLEGEDNDNVQQIIVKHTATNSSTKASSSSTTNKGVKKNDKVNKVKPDPLPTAASKLKKPEPRASTVYLQPQKVQRSRLQQEKAVGVQQSPDNLKDMINNIRAGLNGKVVNNNNIGLGKDKEKDMEKEKEVESVVMTLEEYENKKKAVEAEKKKKTEERKVNFDKDFEAMRLVCKKEQEDGVYSVTINSAAKKTKKVKERKTVNKIEVLWKKGDDEEITRVEDHAVTNVEVSRCRSWSNLPKDLAASTPATRDFPTLQK